MNFDKFLLKPGLVDILFNKLGLLTVSREIIRVNNYPDYDFLPYKGMEVAPYFFKNSWQFQDSFYAVIDADFENYGIFNHSYLEQMYKEARISFRYNDLIEVAVQRLVEAEIDFEIFLDNYLENFSVKQLKISHIDNFNRKVIYSGLFEGDTTAIEDDLALVAQINIFGLNVQKFTDPIYRALLADSYLHFIKHEYNQAFFYAFTGFETFVNQFFEKGQLKQKILKMERKKNKIYDSLKHSFGEFEEIRNVIAHGKHYVQIDEDLVKKFFALVIPFILYVQNDSLTYRQLLKS